MMPHLTNRLLWGQISKQPTTHFRLPLFSTSGDGFAGFLVGGATALGLALVPELFALGQGEFDFDFAILEIHAGGDQSESLLLGLANELANFFFVKQKFAGAENGMIGVVAVLIGADVAVEEPEFALLDQAVGVLEIGLAGANGLYFGSGENHSGLEFFEQEIVVTCVPVNGGILLPGGGGLAARILLPIGLGLVGSLLGHGTEEKVSRRGKRGLRCQVSGLRKSKTQLPFAIGVWPET